jgi:hypothetical protein
MLHTPDYIANLIHYQADTGKLIWRVARPKGVRPGDEIKNKVNGYVRVSLSGRTYAAHRVAWLLHYGSWPDGQVDHINGVRSDNRITNLRVVTHRENCQNRVSHRNGRLPGCHYATRDKTWRATFQENKKQRTLGYFATEQEAHERYLLELKRADLQYAGRPSGGTVAGVTQSAASVNLT